MTNAGGLINLNTADAELLKMVMSEMNLSARAYDRVLKVARTIADLAGAETITTKRPSISMNWRSSCWN